MTLPTLSGITSMSSMPPCGNDPLVPNEYVVRVARLLRKLRNQSLIHDGSLWDGGVQGAMDKLVEQIAADLMAQNVYVNVKAFALNAGHSRVRFH